VGKKKSSKKSKKAAARAAHPLANVLVSLQEKPSHLQEVGSRHPAAATLDFAGELLKLAAADEVALAELGFGAPWRSALESAVGDARTKSAARTEASDANVPARDEVTGVAVEARAWLKRYGTVVHLSGPLVRKSAPKVDHVGHALRQLATALDRNATFIESHAAETEGHGGGNAFAAKGHDLAERLRDAREDHAAVRAELPESELEVYAAVGLVYLELVRLSHAAHEVVPSARAKKYSVDQLVHHHRPSSATRDAGSASPPGARGEASPPPAPPASRS
jgi:hypothetical protein